MSGWELSLVEYTVWEEPEKTLMIYSKSNISSIDNTKGPREWFLSVAERIQAREYWMGL